MKHFCREAEESFIENFNKILEGRSSRTGNSATTGRCYGITLIKRPQQLEFCVISEINGCKTKGCSLKGVLRGHFLLTMTISAICMEGTRSSSHCHLLRTGAGFSLVVCLLLPNHPKKAILHCSYGSDFRN